MPYLQIGLCIVGASLFFNAGRIEADAGRANHALLWAALSVLTSVLAFAAGAGWVGWLLAQGTLMVVIAMLRLVLSKPS
ncbi:MAG: hypothetical protein ACT4NL_12430 [Pseudomarimonas sp.]